MLLALTALLIGLTGTSFIHLYYPKLNDYTRVLRLIAAGSIFSLCFIVASNDLLPFHQQPFLPSMAQQVPLQVSGVVFELVALLHERSLGSGLVIWPPYPVTSG
jgi:hypothetical protein